jgi:hypothetical protein
MIGPFITITLSQREEIPVFLFFTSNFLVIHVTVEIFALSL